MGVTHVAMSACTTSAPERSTTLTGTTISVGVSGLFLGQRNLPPGGAEMLFKN